MSVAEATTAPRERPILFSAPMVRAILAGAKTQTRRIVTRDALRWLDVDGFDPGFVAAPENALSPYGYAGDRLWVRETWAAAAWPLAGIPARGEADIQYAADGVTSTDKDGRWRPSIFLPRWASRITLEVTGVRVERLQTITEEDVAAEGTPGMVAGRYQCHDCNGRGRNVTWPSGCPRCEGKGTNAVGHFRRLWDQINGERAPWASNPWIWVVSFRRLAS